MIAAIASVICSVITLFGTIFTVSSGNKKAMEQTMSALARQSSRNDSKLEAKLNEFKAVTDTRVGELTRKVEKHNHLIERMYRIEGAVAELQRNRRAGD